MKKIIDRLMARQQALLQSLGPEPARAPQPVPLSAQQRDAKLQAEAQAIDAAFELLQDGRLEEARALLLPHTDDALNTRTLTTLARIASIQGHLDAASELLMRAEQLDPADAKVLFFTAELLKLRRRHVDELQYRRRLAYGSADVPPQHFVPLLTAIVKAAPKGKPPPLSEIRLTMDRIRSAPDLSNDAKLEVARAIFDVKPFTDEARSLVSQVDPLPHGYRDVVARWALLPTWCRLRQVPLHRTLDHGESGRRPSLAEIPEAIVHPGLQWIPLLDDGSTVLSRFASSRIRLRSEDPLSPMLLAGEKRALVRLPEEMPVIEGPALLVGGNGLYYHDMVEYFGALAVADTLGLAQDVKLLLNADPAPHQVQLLSLLGVPESRIVRCDPRAPVRVTQLLLPTRLAAGGRWFDPLLAQWYRRRLVSAQPAAPTASRKLYLSRSGTTRRRIVNEDEVARLLESLGYECIRPETLTLRDQIALFAQASHIVGSTGAALTNMVFAPPGALVLVLQNRHLIEGGGDLYFDALAISCGHRPETLPCSPVKLTATQRAIDADLAVDLAALRALLS